jgi:hypothetical protein
LKETGRRGWTRTSDHLLRRQVLYPPELRARVYLFIDPKPLPNSPHSATRYKTKEDFDILKAVVDVYEIGYLFYATGS